ncbi:MAG: hypothetical protein WCB11_19760 [Terriglobales bacterium]
MVCRAAEEAHIRALLLTTITQSIRSQDIEGTDRTTVRAEGIPSGQKNEAVEQIATRLSFEPGIAAVSWSVVPISAEYVVSCIRIVWPPIGTFPPLLNFR